MNACEVKRVQRKMNVEKDECGDKKRVERKMNVESSNCVGKCCGGFFLSWEKRVCMFFGEGGGWGLAWI
jgi:hypothetical protein